jgi:menaquinone-dependent protoporphyrinogen oxidase
MARVLVVHASKHGSTRDVAERVAERLRQRGHQVDIQAARGLRVSLDGYQLA